MKTLGADVAQTVTSDPKVVAGAVALGMGGGFEVWLINVLPIYISLTAGIIGVVAAFVLTLKNYFAMKKVKLETEIMSKEITDSAKNKQIIDDQQLQIDSLNLMAIEFEETIKAIDERKKDKVK